MYTVNGASSSSGSTSSGLGGPCSAASTTLLRTRTRSMKASVAEVMRSGWVVNNE